MGQPATPVLFTPASIGPIRLRNRIVRSATHEGMAADDGGPGPDLAGLYRRLARGGVGLIVTGSACVSRQGMGAYHRIMMLDRDELVPAWRGLVDSVHAEGVPIAVQLLHAGRQTRSKVTGLPTAAPSALRDRFFPEDRPAALDEAGIEAVIEDFVAAVGRAKAAGFDAAQLHLGHGYLLSAFLSPATNRRRDRWGGSPENRYRIVGEIFRRARERHGDYPVMVKLNAFDFRPGGLRLADAPEIARRLEASGCAAIEVTQGMVADGFATIRGRLPVREIMEHNFLFKDLPAWLRAAARPFLRLALRGYRPWDNYGVEPAAAIKAAVGIPVMAVGGIRTREDMEGILARGQADFVSLCRPLILEPELPRKLAEGKTGASRCIDCNCCMIGVMTGRLRCHFGKMGPPSRD
jgi:2,4-dienoyl-CoA reductase-like NADH-dependent reductase (Old Yellow Enzyme family)